MNEKQIKAQSDIQRAIGMLEGISYIVSNSASSAIGDAINIIEDSLKELAEDG